ncbi:MAG: PTS sugar transporter subunit IIA [Treponema sp.]|jgi:mannitol/fructose-specific phosphotransferase system IIA component (Ntr-type)|nr:PTS sugar transporter subunit IIA [Treponema sp.]
MRLSNVFTRELIKLDLEGKTKNEVFKELVGTIAGLYPEYGREEMLDAVLARENQMNTAVLPGIAVPHGYCSAVGGIIGAAGFSRTGIEYGSSRPVHSVFLLLLDNFSRERHLQVLSCLLRLFNSEFLAMIGAAKSPQEVYDILYRFR